MTTIQPPLPPAPPPAQAQPQPPAEGEVVNAQIVKLPESLAATDRALTLKGEVIAQNPDGTVRIATPRGPIDVKLPEGQTVQRGQTVEVQIPAGTPPRTVTVTLPQAQLPPDIPRPAQPLPPTQIPTPQAQTQQPLPDTPDVILGTRGQPPVAGTLPTPAPATPGTPQQPAQTLPQPPATNLPFTTDKDISPKGLLEILKTSLQAAIDKTTGGKDAAQPQAQTQATSVFTQKPLVIGQLARLTPLMGNQTIVPQLQSQTATTATPSIAFAKASATLTLPITQAQAPLTLPVPATTTQTAQAPLQTTLQTILGSNINLGIPQSGGPDPISRLLLPLLTGFQTSQPEGTLASAKPILVSIQSTAPLMAPILGKGQDAQLAFTPLPHQRPVTIPTLTIGPQTIPGTDVKVAGIVPTAPMITLQNPGNATLLHGTPTSPVMFATVTGQTPQGLPILQLTSMTTLPDGTQKPTQNLMVLQFPARGLAPSTVLRLDVLPGTQPVTLAAGTPLTRASLTSTLPWASLDDALGILHAEPQGQPAIPLLQAALPKPGGTAFTAPVLMFVAAMRGGDVTNWIGEKTVDLLRATKRGDALTRIASDFATQSRENAEAPRGEWKSLTLPMIYGQEISRITLHSRSFERDDEDNPGQKKSGTRFVMDISLTRMGDLQIDGLSIEKKLDVTLRTEKPLSATMREEVRARYTNALQGIGFAGHLNFNASIDHKGWVDFSGTRHQRESNA